MDLFCVKIIKNDQLSFKQTNTKLCSLLIKKSRREYHFEAML